MYNFNLEKGESILGIFDDIFIIINDKQLLVSVAISNKRIMLLDYQSVEPFETLKNAQASYYIKMKEVIFSKCLKDIIELKKDSMYKVVFKDNYIVSFEDKELFNTLKRIN
jgi:hypothetical protein